MFSGILGNRKTVFEKLLGELTKVVLWNALKLVALLPIVCNSWLM